MGLITAPFCNYPDTCPHCKIKFCSKCATALKAENPPVFCYGCGTLSPEVRAKINRTSNISCCYMDEEWRKKNMGRYADGPYMIATGYADNTCTGPHSSWLMKRGEDDKLIQIRELTDEEKALIKGK